MRLSRSAPPVATFQSCVSHRLIALSIIYESMARMHDINVMPKVRHSIYIFSPCMQLFSYSTSRLLQLTSQAFQPVISLPRKRGYTSSSCSPPLHTISFICLLIFSSFNAVAWVPAAAAVVVAPTTITAHPLAAAPSAASSSASSSCSPSSLSASASSLSGRGDRQ
jgi:hypothetical protein